VKEENMNQENRFALKAVLLWTAFSLLPYLVAKEAVSCFLG
jgi:hypothetical protein